MFCSIIILTPPTIQQSKYDDGSSGGGHKPVKELRDLPPSLLLQLLQYIYLYQPYMVTIEPLIKDTIENLSIKNIL